jgi:hypothetical protein
VPLHSHSCCEADSYGAGLLIAHSPRDDHHIS